MPLTRFSLDVPLLADPHMAGPNLEILHGAIGTQLDNMAEQIMQARLQGNPFAGGANATREGAARLADGRLIECEELVLNVHSQQRGIRLYETEGVLSRRVRLSQHLRLKAERGTHWGEMMHVRPYFADFVAAGGAYPTISIVSQTNEATPRAVWYTMAADGARRIRVVSPSNWDLTGEPAKRTRWTAIVHLPVGFAAYLAAISAMWDGSDLWDGPAIWDGIQAAVLADLYAMFEEWQGAHSWLWALVFTTLQPGDDIPGHPGRHPFDPADTSITLAGGSTSLPVGNWGQAIYTSGPSLGLNTRPSWATFYNVSNG